jgi:serine/threonine protein kinase
MRSCPQEPTFAGVRRQIRGVRIGRYELIEELGQGGMATVVLARDLLLGRYVALKLLQTNDLELTQRFITEARITARCRHVNIIVVHDMGEHEGVQFIALEYLRGKPLAKLIERDECLPYTRAVEILVPLLRALQCIHDAGVVHRDLKPDNIFMTDAGMPKLLDFGIAKEISRSGQTDVQDPLESAMGSNTRSTRVGMILGTPEYMSPEQWGNGVEIDHLTDIWACGLLLHRLICGRHPLYSLDGNRFFVTAALDLPMPSMRESAPPEVPRGLIEVVDRCLLKRKEQRWQRAEELLEALLPFLPGCQIPIAQPDTVQSDTQIRDEDVPAACHASYHPSDLPTAVSTSPPQATKHTILCLASDSTEADGSTQLGRQSSVIRKELERARGRDRFEIVTQFASEPLDLLRVLRSFKPTVVYFASNGRESTEYRPGQALVGDRFGGLFFRGQGGHPQFLSASAIQQTFEAAGGSVRLVVLSGCYSDLQAEALLSHVDCVVGTRGTILPEAAQAYAIGLMGALGEYESIATAHKQACAAIGLVGLGGGDAPQIKVRRGLDASKLVLASIPARPVRD